jgi:hypothetical protein
VEAGARKRECASLRLQLNVAAKLAVQGTGEESAAAVQLLAARDNVALLATAVTTE